MALLPQFGPAEPPLQDGRLKDLRIVVVDDSERMHRLHMGLLMVVGIGTMRTCLRGAEALDVLARLPRDLIISDLNMAPMDGLDFIRAVRAARSRAVTSLPITVVSGRSDGPRALAARRAGANDFLVKPVSSTAPHKRPALIVATAQPAAAAADYPAAGLSQVAGGRRSR